MGVEFEVENMKAVKSSPCLAAMMGSEFRVLKGGKAIQSLPCTAAIVGSDFSI